MKYWEIIADNLSKAGWSLGCVSAIDSSGRTIWTADAHRDDGKRFVVRAEENLSIAKGETAPVTEPWRYVYLLGTVPDPGHIPGVFLHTHHRIVPYDNDFTVKWRRGFGRKKRS